MGKLNLNTSKLKIPNGDYTFALNLVEDLEKQGNYTNELGNIKCGENLPDVPVGIITLNRNQVVVFCANNSIQLIDTENCVITQLVQDDGFNFNTDYPITGSSRVVQGCQVVIYWHDHLNPDRYYNIDRPEKFETNNFFDISKTEFNPDIVHPTINRTILNTGGKLGYGNYNFAIEFLNQNEDVIFQSPVDINYTPITISNNEGALNISTNLPDVGGKPLSNKSIKLNVTNIPEDAVLARIIVFGHVTSDGITVDTHVVGQLIPVNGTTLEYTYRGFNPSNGDYLVDKNEFLTPKAIYQSSLNSVQVNNRLVRYNLKETIRNYSNYQEKASKICSKYVVKEISKNDSNFYLLNQTFLGGEIILPCINWVHKDGSISNTYPLIGRAKNTNDAIQVDDIFNVGQQLEKWQLFDTSIKDTTPIDGYVSSGEFGYYESDQIYSDLPNYCGTNYWGLDCNGNILEGEPVRLFVVPDRSVESHDDGDNIRPIGIWFDETTIEFPNDDVVGYYFSVVEVNQSNITAKGLGVAEQYYITNNGDKIIPSVITGGNTPENIFNFHSANFHLGQEYVNGNYIGIEGNWNETLSSDDEEFKRIFHSGLPYDQIHIWLTTHTATPYISDAENPVLLNKSTVIPSSTEINNVQNVNYTLDFNILEVPDGLTNPRLKYIAVKNFINPIPNIWAIQTRRITNLGETVSFNGDNFISELVLDDVFDFNVEGFSGLEFALKFIKFGPYSFLFSNEGLDLDAYVEILKGFYIESKYNSNLRHLGTDVCSKHFQNTNNKAEYFLDKLIEPYNGNYKLRDSFCQFFPGYNKDYSYVQDLNRYSTIGFTFDFCSSCTGLYPHRMIFSPQSFSEDLADGYRINRANDYIDIPANTGAIVAVDFKDNKLVVRTERACYFLQPNPQQMETSESNVYIGTGDFLSIPPQELNITPVGYGGQQHKLDSINCEKGLIWSDRQRGDIYLLGGEFREISLDMAKWFIDELPEVQHLIFGYDPKHERLLMTGKNNWTLSYSFEEKGWKSWHSYIPDWYIYNAETMFSILDTGLWEHNKGKFTTYYGLEFPHVVEMIINAQGQTFLPQSVIYHANTYDLSNGYDQDVIGVTYDQFLAYNDTQSTGFQDLILNSNNDVFWNPTSTHVKQVDRNYKISPLKDLVTSSNIWTNDITSIKQNGQGYFRYLPIVDINKPMVQLGTFRSKWLGIWLISNQHQYKISLEFETINKQNSIR